MSMPNIPNQCKLELLSMGFKMDKVLGSGCWGKVIRAYYKNRPEHSAVAIKIIDKTKVADSDWIKVEREMEAMIQLTQGQAGKGEGHPNIIHLIQTLETTDYVYFVLECCSGKQERRKKEEKRGRFLFLTFFLPPASSSFR
jgi:serine/threonine protein kinase